MRQIAGGNRQDLEEGSDGKPRAILVTGASGLLGANLVLNLQERGKEVIAVSHRCRLTAPGVRSLQADLTASSAVQELLENFHVGWIIHCAAVTNVDWCEANPEESYRVNAELPRQLAAAARLAGAHLVYISTDAVFRGESGSYSEEDVPAPLNIYAQSKLAGEIAVCEASEENLVVRTNIYGWNLQEKESLAEWILHRLEVGQTVPAFHDVRFTPILVNDLSEVISEMIEKGLVGLYHVAGSDSLSKYEFACLLADTFAFNRRLILSVSIADSALKAARPRNVSLATDKISRLSGRTMPAAHPGLLRFQALRNSGFVAQLRALKG